MNGTARQLVVGGASKLQRKANKQDDAAEPTALLESQNPERPAETIFGTAFSLEGRDLVMCNHCLGNEPIVAYKPAKPGTLMEQHSVTITHRDARIDLARLCAERLGADRTLSRCAVGRTGDVVAHHQSTGRARDGGYTGGRSPTPA